MNSSRHTSISQWFRVAGVALGIYWCGLFVLTHLPPEFLLRRLSSADQMMAEGGDKVMHLVAYALLAFLFASWLGMRGMEDRRLALRTLGILAIYAVLDELLQIPVRRTADVVDCVADWLGIVVGFASFLLVRAILTQQRLRLMLTKISAPKIS